MTTDGSETEELLRAWRDAERTVEETRPDDPRRPRLEEEARDAAAAYRQRIERVSGERVSGELERAS